MDPDGDYESRHSIRSTASDNGNPIDDVASPSKIFAPGENTKLPAKPTNDGDAYDGPTAPPMEGPPPPSVPSAAAAAAATSSHRAVMEPRGTAYDDMMSGKMDGTGPDEVPISNSVAVPIGFDSEDLALPEAKALPIISSTANEGSKMTPATMEEVDVEDAEAPVDEEGSIPSLPGVIQNSTTAIVNEGDMNADEVVKETPTTRSCTRKRMMCCCGIVTLCALLGIIFGVLYGTTQGQLFIKGVPNCDLGDGYYVSYYWPSEIGDGWCSGFLNTAECGWDGGDCLVDGYPDCHVDAPGKIGDGDCDGGQYNTAECGWDGGDCVVEDYPDCHVDSPRYVGDGGCDGGEHNTAECGWDGGDCEEFNSRYPNCKYAYPYRVGNGQCNSAPNTAACGWDGGDCLFDLYRYEACNGVIGSTWANKPRSWCQTKCIDEGTRCKAFDYNPNANSCRLYSSYSSTTSDDIWMCRKKKEWTAECGWDGGDCVVEDYPDCHVNNPDWVGDGYCDGENYNTAECGWDGGDCPSPADDSDDDGNEDVESTGDDENAENNDDSNDPKVPDWPECHVADPDRISDGNCNDGDYNTAPCGWDGGDCLVEGYPDCHASDPSKIGNGYCDGEDYNTAECGWDGFDCLQTQAQLAVIYPDCYVLFPSMIGNGECQAENYNTAECGWDGGDCNEFNSKYPNCKFSYPQGVGDGRCHQAANTAECSWDGGDCNEYERRYPNCDVSTPQLINDGHCDNYGEYNTEECGWDGGDCLFNTYYNNACTGTIGPAWTDKTRAWCQYKCMDEGADCEAYDYNDDTDMCRLFSSFSSTTDNNNRDCWKKK